MLISEDKITGLIPQRPPMVMIHSLVSCNSRQAVTRLEIRSDNIFLDKNGMTASGLMENMAQTAAARTGFLLQNQPGGQNKKAPFGVIGSIKNFRLYFQPGAGSVVETTITVEHEVMQAILVKGTAEVDGKLAAEADLQIYLTDNQSVL
jgi:3-hydroxymyristoyl/3-hydroxydecanoyl-(acyl carrier protein) dehydratase